METWVKDIMVSIVLGTFEHAKEFSEEDLYSDELIHADVLTVYSCSEKFNKGEE